MMEVDAYVETYRQEVAEHLAAVEEAILVLEQTPDDLERLNQLFRAMHTIKGSGSMFGFDVLAEFTHHVETVLDMVRDGQVPITSDLTSLILQVRDEIEYLMSVHGNAADERTATRSKIVERLYGMTDSAVAFLERKDENGECQETQPGKPGSLKHYNIRFLPERDICSNGTNPLSLLGALRALGTCRVRANTQNVPALDELDPESCWIDWEIDLVTAEGVDEIRDVFIFVEDRCVLEIGERATEPASITEPSSVPVLPEASPVAFLKAIDSEVIAHAESEPAQAAQVEPATVTKLKNETVRVPADKLDKLVNLIGELVINQAQLTRVSTAFDSDQLTLSVEEAGRFIGELRDSIMGMRMMPIGSIFGRFIRLVRDLSIQLGKDVDLVTEGAETELDKTVIEHLFDPLVHLIRNCVDHGLETPDEREKLGKPRQGKILLSAEHVSTHIRITIADDGKGLDPERIRQKAIQRGLIAEDSELSEREVFSLIFAPGLSTASQITNVSGRGVGLDVVKREIESLRGTVSVNSEPGRGVTIQLLMPLTLAIIDGLHVQVGTDSYVVPVSAVEECMELNSKMYALGRKSNVIELRNELLPLIRLRETMCVRGERPPVEEVVVVNAGDCRVGLVVDHIVGDLQTVIKPLGEVYKNAKAVSGATILGDGSVALIVDSAALAGSVKRDRFLRGRSATKN